MATRKKRQPADSLLEALREARGDPRAPAARDALERALGSDHWLAIAEAAEIVGEHVLDGFEKALQAVWPRLVPGGKKSDPGCRAKEAALTALDQLETLDPQPFLAAARYRQLEPGMGGSEDTAGGVRARALFALLRIGHEDAPLLAGELMADANPQARSAACRALGHYGDRAAAGLLAYKLAAGDAEPSVVSECALALLSAAPDFALPLLRAWLAQSDELKREAAALTLGQSARAEALSLLLAWVQECSWDRDLLLGVRALGLSRDERAREFLLGLVESGRAALARAAVEALAVHSYDERLRTRVLESAAKNGESGLRTLVERAFQRGR